MGSAVNPELLRGRNNRIQAQNLLYNLSANPTVAASPSCLSPGRMAVLLSGTGDDWLEGLLLPL